MESKNIAVYLILGLVLGAGVSLLYFQRNINVLNDSLSEEKTVSSLLQEQVDNLLDDNSALTEESDQRQNTIDDLNDEIQNLKEEMNPPPPSWPTLESAEDLGGRVTCPFTLGGRSGNEVVIKILNLIRGEDAYDLILRDYPDTRIPSLNHEYLVVNIEVEYSHGLHSTIFNEESLNAYSQFGVAYEPPWVNAPDPYLGEFSIYPGWTINGWLTFEISKTDYQPYLVFVNGYWLKMYD